MIATEQRTCPVCSRAFTPSRGDQKFDHTNCKNRAARLRRAQATTEPLREQLLEEEEARGNATRGEDGVYRPTAAFLRKYGQAFRDLDLWLEGTR